ELMISVRRVVKCVPVTPHSVVWLLGSPQAYKPALQLDGEVQALYWTALLMRESWMVNDALPLVWITPPWRYEFLMSRLEALLPTFRGLQLTTFESMVIFGLLTVQEPE